MNKQINIPHWLVYLGLLFAACIFVFLFSCTTSPLYEHHPFWFYGDSGVFQEIGVCLLQGGTPYVDLFDHKGPVLWFIQALGKWINSQWGILLLQSLSLLCCLSLLYNSIFYIVRKSTPSFFITVSGLLFLMAFYQRGNLCEEWSLPFIILPIYLYFNKWKKQEDQKAPIYNHTDAFILGLCVGILAMIRLNNATPIIGFALWHFVKCLQHKESKRLWTDIALVSAGITIIFLLCSTFYLVKAGWYGVYEMIYGTFIFNFIYFDQTWRPTLLLLLQQYFLPVVFLIITLICSFKDKTTRNISLPVVISYSITIFCLGFTGFLHYFMILIPLFVITMGLLFHMKALWMYLLWLCCCAVSIHFGYDAIDHLVFRLRGKKARTEMTDGFHQFINTISISERKSIYNVDVDGFGPGMFAKENTYQCNRIIHLTHLSVSPRLREYVKTHSIKEFQPIWVLTQSQKPEAVDEYMQTHYTLFDSIPGGEFDPIWCWKRNE